MFSTCLVELIVDVPVKLDTLAVRAPFLWPGAVMMQDRPILPSSKPILPAIDVELSQDSTNPSALMALVSSYERDRNIKPWIAHKPLN